MKIYLHQYFEQCYDTFLIVDKLWNDQVKIRLGIDKIKNDSFHIFHTQDNRDTGL